MGRNDYLKPLDKSSEINECPPEAYTSDLNAPIQDGDCVCNLTDISNDEDEVNKCFRYAAYGNRIKTVVNASIKTGARYLAYTSDIGESFRPVIPRLIVRLGYAVSWTYVITDVAYHSWKAKLRQEGRYKPGLMPWHRPPVPDKATAAAAATDERDWRVVAVKEMVFQSVASMGLPAFTIHTVVSHSGFLYKNFRNCRIRKFGPVATGLAIVPFLPFMYDKPCEIAIEWLTEKAETAYEQRHTKKKP